MGYRGKMLNMLAEFVLQTEMTLRGIEKNIPQNSSHYEWLMWLAQSQMARSSDLRVRLREVREESDWEKMFEIRKAIEKKFGVLDEETVRGFVSYIRSKAERLQGKWFLACLEDRVVGEVGIVPFERDGKTIGRLQDVDIVPDQQGRGLGRQMMGALFNEARSMKLEALCLFAREEKWVKDWYARLGFIRVGRVYEDRGELKLLV